MKQKLVTALVIIVCFIFQCTIFKGLALASISPNLLLIFTTSMGFMRGEREGLVIGFFCGLLMDIFFGSLLGFYALLYMFLGYGSGLFHMIFYDEDIKLPMIWIALSELVYGLSIYFFLFFIITIAIYATSKSAQAPKSMPYIAPSGIFVPNEYKLASKLSRIPFITPFIIFSSTEFARISSIKACIYPLR